MGQHRPSTHLKPKDDKPIPTIVVSIASFIYNDA